MRCGSRLEQLSSPATQQPSSAKPSLELPVADLVHSKEIDTTRPDLVRDDFVSKEVEGSQIVPVDPLDDSHASGAALDEVPLHPEREEHPPEQESNPWRYELSERLEKLRERRERARNSFDPSTSLELGFNGSGEPAEAEPGPFPITAAPEHSPVFKGNRKQQPIEDEFAPNEKRPQPAERQTGEGENWSLDLASSRSLELEQLDNSMDLVGSQAGSSAAADEATFLRTAPLGRRFVAGVVDALVLLAAGGVFALIFGAVSQWRVSGPISWNRVDIAILGLLVVVGIMSYFASFAALTSSTPGMLLMDLELRNMEGDPPTPADSIFRALGYVVSLSALMLGFIWAAVDSEGLTWHDRMSGTLVTTRDRE